MLSLEKKSVSCKFPTFKESAEIFLSFLRNACSADRIDESCIVSTYSPVRVRNAQISDSNDSAEVLKCCHLGNGLVNDVTAATMDVKNEKNVINFDFKSSCFELCSSISSSFASNFSCTSSSQIHLSACGCFLGINNSSDCAAIAIQMPSNSIKA